MDIDLWPIVGRAQLVQAFRPGEPVSKEAPFRTLRHHQWATGGVSVVTRNVHRASGRVTIFSVLNVEAARCAREGHARAAMALAKAASRVEGSEMFTRLTALLTGRPASEVTAAVDGVVAESEWPELLDALRLVARATRDARSSKTPSSTADVVAGKISGELNDFLVLDAQAGVQTYVPRWLAQSAHRDNVGDFLALVTEKLDETQMVVKAVPAINVDPRARASASPFGRSAPVRDLSAGDARLLSGTPALLKILVPVTIGR